MSRPHPELLGSRDLRAALDAVGDIGAAADSAALFAQVGVQALTGLVASELTTLSRCNLRNGTRIVFGARPGAIGAEQRAAFDRHFSNHPLVRYHAFDRGRHAHRITDSLSMADFRRTPLFNDYYRPIGLSHALALPVRMDGGELVSFVFNRAGHDFTERELALLDALRRPLARLFHRAVAAERAPIILSEPTLVAQGLTPREAEVLQWVAAGKTDRDTAELLGCSPRTVHKHLQRIYAKLGVETRTAAVMRALSGC
jgi:DNA-binding CsgD family transcriptional regulator